MFTYSSNLIRNSRLSSFNCSCDSIYDGPPIWLCLKLFGLKSFFVCYTHGMDKNNNLKSDVDFLFEMGSIRFISRMWQRFLNDDFANLAEHHFRMFWIAMVIAAHEKSVDTGKLAKLVLVPILQKVVLVTLITWRGSM